ncbi:MAG: GFA family protein [Burkholderiaceae bacterium]
MSKIEGGCLCGSVRYECAAEPLMTAVCHCTHCQKQTGTSFSILVAVPQADLNISGTTRAFQDTGDSGNPVERHFCPDCGSPIYSRVTALPDRLFIKAGTLDDTSWLKPVAHIYCDSAQSWVDIASDVPQFAGAANRG